MPRTRHVLIGLATLLFASQGCFLIGPGLPPAASGLEGTILREAKQVAINAGSLTGVLRGPSASLIANNAGSLVANNGAGLISNNGGGYRVRATATDDRFTPVAGAQLVVTDLAGGLLSAKAVTTDATGAFVLKGLKASGPVVVLQATYVLDKQPITQKILVGAPRQGTRTTDTSPGQALMAKKILTLIGAKTLTSVTMTLAVLDKLTQLATTWSGAMSDRAVAIAVLSPDAQAAEAFDAMLVASPALAAATRSATVGTAASALTAKALSASASAAPASTPPIAAVSSGPSTAPLASSAPTASTAPTASVAPSVAPSAEPTPRLYRLAGADAAGTTEATGGDLLTARFTEQGGLAYDDAGGLYYADESRHSVRRIDLAAKTTTRIAGTGVAGFSGDGGQAALAQLKDAHGIAFSSGKLYICDKANQRIRVMGTDGVIDTVAGGGTGTGDGPGKTLLLAQTQSITAGQNGVMFFCQRPAAGSGVYAVRRLDADGTVTTIADKTRFNFPGAMAIDRTRGYLYVTNRDAVRLMRNAYATPSAPEVVFTAPATGKPIEVRGLAYDQVGTLYMLVTDYEATQSLYGHSGTRIFKLAIDPTNGLPVAGAQPVAIAGSGGSSATPADYSPPASGVLDPLTQLLTGGASNALTMGPTGTLFIGNGYKVTPPLVMWHQVLKLAI